MPIIISIITSIVIVGGAMFFDGSTYGGDNYNLGATSYPTSLDSFTNPSGTDKTNSPSHSSQHSNANDAIEALQAKVGADGSAVTTSHDYKLSGVTGSDLACSLTGTETLTNKTLTSPYMTDLTATGTTLIGTHTITGTTTNTGTTTLSGDIALNILNTLSIDLGSDGTGDVYYRNSSGNIQRLPAGSDGQVLKLASGVPSWAVDQAGGGVLMRAFIATTSGSIGTGIDVIDFNKTLFDTASAFSTSTFSYVVQSEGYYEVQARLALTASQATNMYIYVNGNASSTAEFSSTQEDAFIHDVLYFYAGDTINIRANLDTSGSETVSAGTTTSYFIVKGL